MILCSQFISVRQNEVCFFSSAKREPQALCLYATWSTRWPHSSNHSSNPVRACELNRRYEFLFKYARERFCSIVFIIEKCTGCVMCDMTLSLLIFVDQDVPSGYQNPFDYIGDATIADIAPPGLTPRAAPQFQEYTRTLVLA